VAISTGPRVLDVFYYDSRWPGFPLTWGLHFDGASWTLSNLSKSAGAVLQAPFVAASWADYTLDFFTLWADGSIWNRAMR